MAYEISEEKTTPKRANELEITDSPTIHLSCLDGTSVAEANQFVFHKIANGTLFIELFPHSKWIENGAWPHMQFTLDDYARKKLIEFLLSPKAY